MKNFQRTIVFIKERGLSTSMSDGLEDLLHELLKSKKERDYEASQRKLLEEGVAATLLEKWMEGKVEKNGKARSRGCLSGEVSPEAGFRCRCCSAFFRNNWDACPRCDGLLVREKPVDRESEGEKEGKEGLLTPVLLPEPEEDIPGDLDFQGLLDLAGEQKEGGEPEKALQTLRAAHELEPLRWEHWERAGDIYFETVGFVPAAACYSRALVEGDSGNWEIWFKRGRSLASAGEIDAALRCFREARVLKPGTPEILKEMRVILETLQEEENFGNRRRFYTMFRRGLNDTFRVRYSSRERLESKWGKLDPHEDSGVLTFTYQGIDFQGEKNRVEITSDFELTYLDENAKGPHWKKVRCLGGTGDIHFFTETKPLLVRALLSDGEGLFFHDALFNAFKNWKLLKRKVVREIRDQLVSLESEIAALEQGKDPFAIYCRRCGAGIPDDLRLCGICGKSRGSEELQKMDSREMDGFFEGLAKEKEDPQEVLEADLDELEDVFKPDPLLPKEDTGAVVLAEHLYRRFRRGADDNYQVWYATREYLDDKEKKPSLHEDSGNLIFIPRGIFFKGKKFQLELTGDFELGAEDDQSGALRWTELKYCDASGAETLHYFAGSFPFFEGKVRSEHLDDQLLQAFRDWKRFSLEEPSPNPSAEAPCPACGKLLQEDWKVCQWCSAELGTEPGPEEQTTETETEPEEPEPK